MGAGETGQPLLHRSWEVGGSLPLVMGDTRPPPIDPLDGG